MNSQSLLFKATVKYGVLLMNGLTQFLLCKETFLDLDVKWVLKFLLLSNQDLYSRRQVELMLILDDQLIVLVCVLNRRLVGLSHYDGIHHWLQSHLSRGWWMMLRSRQQLSSGGVLIKDPIVLDGRVAWARSTTFPVKQMRTIFSRFHVCIVFILCEG